MRCDFGVLLLFVHVVLHAVNVLISMKEIGPTITVVVELMANVTASVDVNVQSYATV